MSYTNTKARMRLVEALPVCRVNAYTAAPRQRVRLPYAVAPAIPKPSHDKDIR